MIIYNEGQPGREELLTGTLGRPFTLPVLGLSFADGDALNAAAKAGAWSCTSSTSTENDLNATT